MFPLYLNNSKYIYLCELSCLDSLKLQFVVMPFHPVSLQQKIAFNQPISEVDFLHYSIQLCKGLQHLHQHKFVHCDIKPSNVLISSENQIVIIDFGMATQIGGTPAGGNESYKPPEANSPDYKISTSYDVFGAGIIMYELLSGQQLFSNPSSFLRWKVPQHTFPMKKTGLGRFTLPSIYYEPSVKLPIKEVVNCALDPIPTTRGMLETIISNLIKCLGDNHDYK